MHYAKSTNGFYTKEVHGDNIPNDAVAITKAKHVELMAGQSAGKIISADAKGKPVLKDAPIVEPVPPKYFTYKTDIWQRVTDAEAETLDTQLNQAPAKQRRMWDDAQSIEHSSGYYTALRDEMVLAFGEARTDDILAPSN